MSQRPKVEVTFSNRTVLRVLGIIIGTLLVLHFVRNVSHVLLLVFTAAFLSLALNPVVSWISRHLRLKSRVAATAIAYILVVAFLATFLSLVVPPLVKQTIDFVREVPSTLNSLKNGSSAAGRFVQHYHLQDSVQGLSQTLQQHTRNIQQPVINTATRVGTALISIITILVLTFMFLVEGPSWLQRYWQLHPKDRRAHDQKLAYRMYRVVTGYVNGQVLIAAIAGVFALVALLVMSGIFNVSINAVALAGIVFLFGLIPLIGNTLAASVVVLVCLFNSPALALAMLIYFIVYQQVENATLYPYIQARNNELTPLLVFVAALLGAGLGGLFGAFVAIPAAGCLKILVLDYFEAHDIGQD